MPPCAGARAVAVDVVAESVVVTKLVTTLVIVAIFLYLGKSRKKSRKREVQLRGAWVSVVADMDKLRHITHDE